MVNLYNVFIDSSGWVQPYILVAERGDCTFVEKVRNGQTLGFGSDLPPYVFEMINFSSWD